MIHFSTCPPLQVSFSNNSDDYSSFSWDFGDGSPSVNPSPQHIYTYPGTYPVKLTVKGYGECTDTLVKNIVIKGPTGKLLYDPKAFVLLLLLIFQQRQVIHKILHGILAMAMWILRRKIKPNTLMIQASLFLN